MDQEIELAKPNFTPLAPEEETEAVRLLAALIRAIPVRRPDSTSAPHRKSAASESLADGSPPVLVDTGKAASRDGAGGRP